MIKIPFSYCYKLLKSAYNANAIGRLANGQYVICHENGWFGRSSVELAKELSTDVVGVDVLRKSISNKNISPPEINELYFFDEKKEFKLDFNSETSLGEPQAWIYLKNGESVEITHEEYGLEPKDQYFSVRLHCSEEDFDNDVYKSTMGIKEDHYCDDLFMLHDAIMPFIVWE